ncbi:Tad domain-containing protein, partial [Sporichthya sp.]|uniref:Tad domain-containing protein n=1 Tax=Sporichthya sp. TaxID=65475 RepID=UPI00345C4F23
MMIRRYSQQSFMNPDQISSLSLKQERGSDLVETPIGRTRARTRTRGTSHTLMTSPDRPPRRERSGRPGCDPDSRGPRAGRAARRSDEGSITPFVVVITAALLAMGGLVVDGGFALAARQDATATAEQAARAGADA